MVAERSVYWWR